MSRISGTPTWRRSPAQCAPGSPPAREVPPTGRRTPSLCRPERGVHEPSGAKAAWIVLSYPGIKDVHDPAPRPVATSGRRDPARVRRGDGGVASAVDELPERVKTPAQLLGRRSTGCEGTHGVFPQCNLGCRPCYHSSDANRVRVDGPHTIANVDAQMAFARRVRGPGAYAQLIGGEVTLLSPDDHAAALSAMRRHGRVPMSFSHGDFDDDYLEALALDADGKPRFDHLAFAIHVDSTMQGRRAVPRPSSEAELDAERARIVAMFDRLRRRHGITSYLAHNMTVTPDNLDQVPGVIARNRHLGYRMFSFQPAAYVGHENRWTPGYRGFGDDDVWARIEEGAGVRLPFRGIQFGDLRCNRVTWGAFVGERYVPVLDDTDRRDLAARDSFFAAFPGPLGHGPIAGRALRAGRAVISHPPVVPAVAGWARRFAQRGGGLRASWHRGPADHVRDAPLHRRRRHRRSMDGVGGRDHADRGPRRGRPTPAGLRLLDAPSRDGSDGARLRATLGARSVGERAARRVAAPSQADCGERGAMT
jgi:hypothetical protein